MAANTVFSATLQKLRKEKGVTQEQLANHLGVSPQAVSKWENGSYPEGDLLPRISEFFGVSISYLYGQESNDISIEQAVMNALSKIQKKHEEDGKSGSNHEEYFKEITDIAWAFQLGFWKNNRDYWYRGEYTPELRNASSITDDAGYAFFNLNREREFYTIVREPENGFANNIKISEKMREFLAFLGKPGVLEILFFMLTLGQSEFVTAETIAGNIGMKADEVEKLLAEMGKFINSSGNPIFYNIDILEKNGPKDAYGINISSVCNYITLLLVLDSIMNPIHGFSMQVNNRWKSYFDRETVLKMIKDHKK